MNAYERKRFGSHEWLESIGGLINATEKLLMWMVVFWSSRLFSLHIFASEFASSDKNRKRAVSSELNKYQPDKGVDPELQYRATTPTMCELLQWQWEKFLAEWFSCGNCKTPKNIALWNKMAVYERGCELIERGNDIE